MSSNAKRVFFALWPDEATRQALRRATRKAVRKSGGRAVAPENFHITLAFLGSVPVERLDCIQAAAGRVRAAPVSLTLDRLGYFARPRLLWLGAGNVPATLTALVQTLNAALGTCGFKPDPRPYRPHVTLARKVSKPGELDTLPTIVWHVRHFVLAESVTAARGPHYQVLESWALNAAGIDEV
jgi:2'-5' RNA ligase